MRRQEKAPAALPLLLAGPPDPSFKTRLLAVFAGHPMEAAIRADRFALGVIPRDRPAAWARLAEMEANPDKARAEFSGEAA